MAETMRIRCAVNYTDFNLHARHLIAFFDYFLD